MDAILAVLLIAMSSARLTRVIVSDKITEPFRSKFLTIKYDEHTLENYYEAKGIFGYFIHCHWCVGFWVTIFNTILYMTIDWYFYVAIALSAAYIQGILNSLEK